MKRFASYLLQGTILIAPFAITAYIIYSFITFIDSMINPLVEQIIGFQFPGLGIVFGVLAIAFIGFLGSTLLFQPLFTAFENFLNRMPLVKIVYSSLKDLFSAFVSDQRKFNKPVMVNMGSFSRMGFLTETDLTHFAEKDLVAVYLPHSYNFSGNLVLVKAEAVTLLDVPASEVMKFVVSGGVTRLEGDK